jgi:parallel beta-helix repeat protein
VTLTDAQTAVIRVPNDFSTIQAAIDASQPGSTILVEKGVYFEHLTINKALTLLGADKENTVIDGSHDGDIVVIEADNVILDGFTLRNASLGVKLVDSNGSTVSGNIVTMNARRGIMLDNCGNNTVSGNIVSQITSVRIDLFVAVGIDLESSTNNTISCNVIEDCDVGIDLPGSSNNSIVGNVIGNSNGFEIDTHDSHSVISSNFIDNYPINRFPSGAGNNAWSESGRGNFWNDYTGLDDGSGGRVAGDGVGDTDLPWHGVDNFPLINPPSPFKVFWDNKVFPASLVSNSTVSAFVFDQADKEITFNPIGPANTTGYFNLSTPTNLLSGPWRILLDGEDVTSKAAITENQTYTAIYLSYSHINHNVRIIGSHVVPEYSITSVLVMLLILSPTIVIATRKRRKRQLQSGNCRQLISELT